MKKFFILILFFSSGYVNSQSLSDYLKSDKKQAENQKILSSIDKIGIEELRQYYSSTNVKNWFACDNLVMFSLDFITITKNNILLDYFHNDVFKNYSFYNLKLSELTADHLELMELTTYLMIMSTISSQKTTFDKQRNSFSWSRISGNGIQESNLVINQKNPSHLYEKNIGENGKIERLEKKECLDLKKLTFDEVIKVYRYYQILTMKENRYRRDLLKGQKNDNRFLFSDKNRKLSRSNDYGF